MEVTQFTEEVIKQLKYYVYRLIDPRTGDTFYIGKGHGNRIFDHIKGALKVSSSEDGEDQYDLKTNQIIQIQNSRFDVIHVIHRHGMEEAAAYEVEAALIDLFKGTSNVQGGYGSNDFGPMHSLDIIQKYSAETANLEGFKVMMITINKSIDHQNIYAATRFAWKVNQNRANQAEYIFSVVRGIIVEVFASAEWKKATIENFSDIPMEEPNRSGFDGVVAPEDIRKLFVGKRVPQEYQKRGAAYPVKYNYL